MSSRLFLLLSLIFPFLQGPFLPPVFTEGILIIFLSLARPSLKVAPIVAISGLLFDFVQNGKLGITSILFLLFVFVLYILREQIQIQKALTLSFVAAFINSIRWFFFAGSIDWLSLIISFVVSYILLSFFWNPMSGGRIRI